MYRAYYGAAGCGPVPPLEKGRWPFREFTNLDDALFWAREAIKRGTTVTMIQGDDGTWLSRNEIASSVRQGSLASV